MFVGPGISHARKAIEARLYVRGILVVLSDRDRGAQKWSTEKGMREEEETEGEGQKTREVCSAHLRRPRSPTKLAFRPQTTQQP